MNKEKKGWIRDHWQPLARLATVAMVVLAPSLVKDKSVLASGNRVVGNLETDYVLELLDRSRVHDQLRFESWDTRVISPDVAVSPEAILRLVSAENGVTLPALTLWTKIRKEGPIKVCAFNYPEPQTCQEVKDDEENVSSYPIKTSSFSLGVSLMIVGSTRLTARGAGKVGIEIEIRDDLTNGLLSSANTTISWMDRQSYIPSVQTGLVINSLKQQVFFPELKQPSFLDRLNHQADFRKSRVISAQWRRREANW